MKNPWMVACIVIGLWVAFSNGWVNFGARVDPNSAAAAVEVRNPLPFVGVGDPRHPQVRFGNQSQFAGLLDGSSNDRQPGPPPQSGQWEEADNSAIQVPAGWTLDDQGPSCPSGTHRVATGKTKTLPNGDVMAQEICQ